MEPIGSGKHPSFGKIRHELQDRVMISYNMGDVSFHNKLGFVCGGHKDSLQGRNTREHHNQLHFQCEGNQLTQPQEWTSYHLTVHKKPLKIRSNFPDLFFLSQSRPQWFPFEFTRTLCWRPRLSILPLAFILNIAIPSPPSTLFSKYLLTRAYKAFIKL